MTAPEPVAPLDRWEARKVELAAEIEKGESLSPLEQLRYFATHERQVNGGDYGCLLDIAADALEAALASHAPAPPSERNYIRPDPFSPEALHSAEADQ